MKKVYTVVLSNPEKCEEIHNLICSHTDSIFGIPNECIDCVDRKSFSNYRTSYLLTEEQVNILKQHPDIESVSLDGKYNHQKKKLIRSNRYSPETYSFRPQNYEFIKLPFTVNSTTYYGYVFPWKNLGSSTNTSLRQTFSKIEEYKRESTNNDSYLVYLQPTNLSSSGSDVISWSKIRTKYQYNPWAGNSSCIIANDNILNGRDGSDVDIVIQDVGVDKYHPDLADAQGNSRVRDIVVHGPQYVDPTYFANNPSKNYIDWWENSSNRSAQFQSLGTLTVPRYTVLVFILQNANLASFDSNIGKKIIQTINGTEYTRGTIVETLDILGNTWFYVKVQLDSGKPHFRYLPWGVIGTPYEGEPSIANQPSPLTIDPDGATPIQHRASIFAGGFVYDEESVLTNNPNNTPIDSTGHFNTQTTMSIIRQVGSGALGNISANSNTITGISTSGLVVGRIVKPMNGIIDSGTTIQSIGVNQITISKSSLNNSSLTGVAFKFSDGHINANYWGGGADGTSSMEYDWDFTTSPPSYLGYTLEYKIGLEGKTRTHGTHCASEAAGLKQGYAPNANIWSIKCPFDGQYWADGSPVIDTETSFDFVRIFHQAKPTNPSYGNKNPTILSGSWGYSASPFYNSQEGDTISYNYRGNTSNFSFADVDLTSVPGFVKNALLKIQYPIDNIINNTSYNYTLGSNQYLSNLSINYSDTSIKTSGQECFNSGVHMCFSSGNSNNYVVKDSNDQDYNNFITVNSETYYLHRVGTPSDIEGSINVGALSCSTKIDGKERKDFYSCKGPGVDLYAPALNTISARSHQKHNVNTIELNGSLPIWNYQYYPNNQKESLYNWFSGTSSACPNVAGVLCLFLQKNRAATTTQAKQWLLGESGIHRTSGSYIDSNVSNPSLSGFWGNYDSFTTTIPASNEQTYNVGNLSIVLNANHHIAYTETAESFMDTDIKLLYNPYASQDYELDITYDFTTSVSNLSPVERETVSITVTTDSSVSGEYYYNIEPFSDSTISANDFVSSSLSGSFLISNGIGTISLGIAYNPEAEGNEKFRVRIHENSLSGNIIAYSDYITITDYNITETEPIKGVLNILNGNGLTFKNLIFK
jgi:subtilisin family serine protease